MYDVFTGENKPFNTDYVDLLGSLFTNAIDSAFGASDFDSADLAFIDSLKENTYQWVKAKSATQFKSFQELLLDETNNVRSWTVFRKEAEKASLIFNRNYLRTEYQTAIASAQSASDWRSYDDEDVLEYSAVGDARTRDLHMKLDGIRLPKSDKFWSTCFPPTDWACRCRVIVSSKEPVKMDRKEEAAFIKQIPKPWRFNPGITGTLFPKDHPYWKTMNDISAQQ